MHRNLQVIVIGNQNMLSKGLGSGRYIAQAYFTFVKTCLGYRSVLNDNCNMSVAFIRVGESIFPVGTSTNITGVNK